MRLPAKVRGWLTHPLAHHPLTKRITGYSAGSVVAIIISEAAFAGSLGWLHTGTTAASAIGFVGGAVPNYILNRRWAWSDRRGRDRKTEITLYMSVAVATFLVAAVVTHWAETGARHLTAGKGWQVALVTAAYLGVSALFFVLKFLIYETLVFTKDPDAEPEPPFVWDREAAELAVSDPNETDTLESVLN